LKKGVGADEPTRRTEVRRGGKTHVQTGEKRETGEKKMKGLPAKQRNCVPGRCRRQRKSTQRENYYFPYDHRIGILNGAQRT